MTHRQYALKHAQCPCRRERMAERSLGRTDRQQGDVCPTVGRHTVKKRFLRGILCRNTRSVHLPVVDVTESIGQTPKRPMQRPAETLRQSATFGFQSGNQRTPMEAGINTPTLCTNIARTSQNKGRASLARQRSRGALGKGQQFASTGKRHQSRLSQELGLRYRGLEHQHRSHVALSHSQGIRRGIQPREHRGFTCRA